MRRPCYVIMPFACIFRSTGRVRDCQCRCDVVAECNVKLYCLCLDPSLQCQQPQCQKRLEDKLKTLSTMPTTDFCSAQRRLLACSLRLGLSRTQQ